MLCVLFSEMHVTPDQMRSAQIPLEVRDYCAHKLVEFKSCKRENMPFVYKCHHQKHAYLMCEYEESVYFEVV